DEQVQLLSRYCKDVVLLFDSDVAGIKASMRSIEILLKQDMEVKIVSLPEGEDPDSFVNKFGKDKFDDLLKTAENFVEYQTRYFDSMNKFDNPADAAETIREIVKSLALINDELKRNLLIKSIAKKFNLREKLLESELDKAIEGMKKRKVPEPLVEKKAAGREAVPPGVEEMIKNNRALYNLEKEIIVLLFEGDKSVVNFIGENISSKDFLIEPHRMLSEMVLSRVYNSENIDPDRIIEGITDENLSAYIRGITLEKHFISSSWEERNPGITPEMIKHKFVKDSLLKFITSKIDKQIKENHLRIESAGSEEEALELMSSNKKLEEEKKNLKGSFEEITIN
ncbi:MAG: toprim domain-containing protein, partial [Ignavibacteria bacterium]